MCVSIDHGKQRDHGVGHRRTIQFTYNRKKMEKMNKLRGQKSTIRTFNEIHYEANNKIRSMGRYINYLRLVRNNHWRSMIT